MIYIYSVSLQLSAGIILLIWSLRSFQDNVLQMYFPGSNAVSPDEKNNVALDKRRLREKANTILLSLFSFVDLIAGYLLSIFAEKLYESIVILTLVLVVSMFVVCAEAVLAAIISAAIYSKDQIITCSDLEQKEIDVMMPISNEVIEEILKS